ncbi:hypothetical protein KSP39_PZI001166 [Platanthera zijinensis]|uniref:Uncharacterized protein n=1 Tax=Platanthera zijinensis TaxID=2320716 RepID=A0AAP0GF01_9ASPA
MRIMRWNQNPSQAFFILTDHNSKLTVRSQLLPLFFFVDLVKNQSRRALDSSRMACDLRKHVSSSIPFYKYPMSKGLGRKHEKEVGGELGLRSDLEANGMDVLNDGRF